MAHLRRLSIWLPHLRTILNETSCKGSNPYSVNRFNYSVFSGSVLKDPYHNVSESYVVKERLSLMNTCAFSRYTTRHFSVTSFMQKKKKNTKEKEEIVTEDDIIDERLLDNCMFESVRKDSRILDFSGTHGVLVVQPWVKWGHNKRSDTSGQLLLDEAVALVATLPGVTVVEKEVVPVKSTTSKFVFGSGTLDRLVSLVKASRSITCVFISLDMLTKMQITALEEAFGRKVLDRYSVVLGIFRHHAQTKEARLQVALAELPYMRKRVSGERDNLIIAQREKHLKAALDKLAHLRAYIRTTREKNSIPTVAVVGYTNSGKTSLIRTITRDVRAEGKDQLFATLDVTAHGGRLACGLEVLFIDTVGFIQNIPTNLVASFKATLEDAICSDVVVHVRDASHPEYELQGNTVRQTLANLPLPPQTPVIDVANKMDLLITAPEDKLQGAHQVSALTGQGIEKLLNDVEEKILKVTGRKFWKFSLLTGSQEIRWLKKAAGVVEEKMDTVNPQITHLLVVLTDQELAAYNRNFRKR